ncbi:MAG TPA: carboxypeptidase-like regulatory domain-containing protein, partial [Candidatus Acidoferrales bacterium]|nr:carboxypeptidase-like regulatory domain-containing protein [Candidatus Acidoferrales bacterium]
MAFRARRIFQLIAVFALVFLLQAPAAFAQSAGATLRGQVTDPSGSAVIGAHVTVTWATGQVSAADTGRDGIFEVKSLPPGTYAVKVTAKGFSPFESLEFEVTA